MSWYLDVSARNKARQEMSEQNEQLREQRQSKLRELKSTRGYPSTALPSLPTSTLSFSSSSSAIRSGTLATTPPPEGSSGSSLPHQQANTPPDQQHDHQQQQASPKIMKPHSPPHIAKRTTTSQLVVGTLRPKNKLLKKCTLMNALVEAQRTADHLSQQQQQQEQQQDQPTEGDGQEGGFRHNSEPGVAGTATSPQHAQRSSDPNENDDDEEGDGSTTKAKSRGKNADYANRITVSNTLLGTGAFGAVYLGMDEHTGELVAVKKVSLAPAGNKSRDEAKQQLELLATEIRLMKNLNHKNVVRYLHAERNKSDLFIFMEYMSGGSLASLLSKFTRLSEPVLRIYTTQVLKGLQYLHRKNIVHRDMKADNVLISTDGVAKISDFGTSREFNDSTNLLTVTGTPWFMAPEVVKGTGHGTPADMWSVGCMMIHLVTGRVPFGEYSNPITAMYNIALHPEKVLTEIPAPTGGSGGGNEGGVSPALHEAITLCLAESPAQRVTAEQLLNHPFFATAEQQQQQQQQRGGRRPQQQKPPKDGSPTTVGATATTTAKTMRTPSPPKDDTSVSQQSPVHPVPPVPLHQMRQQQHQHQQQQVASASPVYPQVRHGDVPVVVPLQNANSGNAGGFNNAAPPHNVQRPTSITPYQATAASTTDYITQQQHQQQQQVPSNSSGNYGTPRSYASRLRDTTQNSFVVN